MAVWPVGHSEQLIADLVDGQLIKNVMFAKAHHDDVTVCLHIQMTIAEYAFRLAIMARKMFGDHGRERGFAPVGKITMQAN